MLFLACDFHKTTTANFWKMIIEPLPILSEKRKKNIILKDDTYKCCTPAFYKQSYIYHMAFLTKESHPKKFINLTAMINHVFISFSAIQMYSAAQI